MAPSFDVIHPLNKGLGAIDSPLSPQHIAEKNWNLLHEDLSLPTAVLYQEKIMHNLRWMQDFIAAYGVKLTPHGKTTMAPKLFQLQLQGGAWGITLATAHQVHVAHAHSIKRILMANQLIGKQNMSIISHLLKDVEFEFFCLVDSAEQINQLGEYFSQQQQRLNVLLELGVDGGRAGVRNAAQLEPVLASLKRWPDTLALCGVELYEGVLKDESSIRTFLQHAVAVTHQLAQQKNFKRSPVILSGAGSAWYDVVAEEFSRADIGTSLDIVLRPGCYLTHDVGVYLEAQKRIDTNNPVAHKMSSSLQPALQLWAYVQSIPEKDKAILSLGKRDAAFDLGLPVPTLHYRPGAPAPTRAPSHWQLTKMMDQHAYMQIAEGDDVRVGDMLGLDISHPCLTFDKWRWLPVIDANYRVVDAVQTFF